MRMGAQDKRFESEQMEMDALDAREIEMAGKEWKL